MSIQASSRQWVNRISVLFLLLVFVIKPLFFLELDETQKAAVFFWGAPVESLEESGLHFVPFWYTVNRLEKRHQLSDSDPNEIITHDKKQVITDDFTLWQVADPTLFIESVVSTNGAIMRIDDAVYSGFREAFGAREYEDIVVTDREQIVGLVTESARASLVNKGISVNLVLTNRIELPAENKPAAHDRMSAERLQTAQTYRSEGSEEALRVTSEADRQARVLKAEARREAAEIRGKADAEAAKIYADAYATDPEFYALMRGLEASEIAFGAESGTDLRFLVDGTSPLISPLLQ